MHILYIHQYFSTPNGASGLRSYMFSQKLIKEGHDVTIVCGSYNLADTGLNTEFVKGKREGLVDGIHVIELQLESKNSDSLFKRSLQFLRYSFAAVKIALTMKYDLLFSTSTPLTVAIPGIIMKLLRKKPFIFEVRDLWPELPIAMGALKNKKVQNMLLFLEYHAYNRADALIGLSPGIVKGIEDRLKRPKPVKLIPNGCDSDIFKPRTKGIRAKYGFADSDFLAIFSGAHGLANGLDAVLDAASVLMKEKNNYIKFIFIGDGKLKPSLIDRKMSEGLDNCFFFDPVTKTEISELVASCDCGLMILANVKAFYFGTSPNKFFDYISSGIPVLNNYPGWVSEMITENECGVSVPPEDPDRFAEGLKILAGDVDLSKKMGANSLKLSKKFSRDLLADQYYQLVKNTIEDYYGK